MKLWNIFRKRQNPTYIELKSGDRIYEIEPPKNDEEFFEINLDKGLSDGFSFNLNLNDWKRFGILKKYTISCELEGEHCVIGNWKVCFKCQRRLGERTKIDVFLNVKNDFMSRLDFYNLKDANEWASDTLEKIIKQNKFYILGVNNDHFNSLLILFACS